MTASKIHLILLGCVLSTSHAADKVTYNTDVRPILSDKCFLCHGPDKKNNKADLRLDTPEGAFAALGKSGNKHAIVPGSLEKSEAWRRIISSDPDEVMPTPKSKLPTLTDDEKRIVARWIEQGAEYQPHWSFVPLPDQIPVPSVEDTAWPQNAIDHFVAAKLETESLDPSPEADPIRLLRRVTLDLTGLPPTLAQIDSFKKDLQADPATAYEKHVDSLLGTIQYAEHMALDWLDTARYADTFGYHSDMDFNAWPYRDWVVKAYREDMPYDQFLTWNIAGDLLPNASREQKLATAYNRLHRITNEGGSNWLEFFVDGVSDRVNTLGTSVLGLTMECSKCHDHKYDPITAKDYFQLYSFFNSINETGVYNHGNISPPPSLLLPTDSQEKDYQLRKEKVTQLESQLTALRRSALSDFELWKTQLTPDTPLTIADQTSHLDFEKSSPNPLESRIQPPEENTRKEKDGSIKKPRPVRGSLAPPRGEKGTIVHTDGPPNFGTALVLDGDNGVIMDNFFQKERYTPFSIGLWIKDTLRSEKPSVIAQRTHGHDVGYNGLDLFIQDGYLTARIYRSWPDNGIGVRTLNQLPQNQWHHLTWTWDGSGRHRGFALYLDGEPLETTPLGDKLYKSVNVPTYQTPGRFMIGAIFRGRGFQGGHVDDLTTFDRALTPLEARRLTGQKVDLSTAPSDQLLTYYLENHHQAYRTKLAQLANAYKAVVKREDSFIEVPVMEETPEPRPAYILARGDFNAPRTEDVRVQRDSLSFLIPFPEDAPRDRLGLAQWLTLPNHPLTSRVYVNRIWQQFFGTGIVATTENFGLQGALPTHPELLDWLSRDLISNNWSTKHLIKTIVLSATYRQDSSLTPILQSRDIANRLLARGPAHRLSGEAIRDSALLTSGLLSEKRGGPPVRPYDPIRNPNPHLDQVHRRSLYTYWRRTRPQNNMIIFDKPSLEVCSVKRTRTNSAAQALVLLNDPQFVEAARHLATTLLSEQPDDTSRLKSAWKKITSLEPTDSQLNLLQEILTEQRAYFKTKPESATKLLHHGLSPLPAGLDQTEAAALAITCQTIYNTDAAVWKR